MLSTRVVVPLVPPAPKPARRLNPMFDLPEAGPVAVVARYVAALPRAERDAIRAALDMALRGF